VRRAVFAFLVAGLSLFARYGIVLAADRRSTSDLERIEHELKTLERHDRTQRAQLENEERLIQRLQRQVQDLQARNHDLSNGVQATEASKIRGESETEASSQPRREGFTSQSQFESAMERFAGQHQFTVVGAAAGSFIYDRQAAQNTFALEFEPIMLFKLNDWILFEGSVQALLPLGSAADFELPVATAQMFLNDYLEVNAGIFDQPFGDWYEDQSPVWVNRFITAPLPYGAGAIIPPTDVGIQLRGSAQWGDLGQDIDYTTWVANGPSFAGLPAPVVGQLFNGQNNIGLSTNGRAFGTRVRVYPIPVAAELGRLEVGASSYDGKWQNGLWFNSWGLDIAYLKGNLQARGEFADTYRQMPSGLSADNRQGWYVQAGYFLQGLPSLQMGEDVDNTVRRLEALVRYSGVNQRAIVEEQVSTTPSIGFSGSPAVFSPHAREVALGLDYWIEPSIVWQTELDLELPGAGGTRLLFKGGNSAIASPINHTNNDAALLTQLSIGF
jgi:hypothetical protein